MVHIYPFCAVRPAEGKAQDIAAVPYDVVSANEVRDIITAHPNSFLKISRTDALLADIDPYDDRVYQESRKIFDEYIKENLFVKEEKPCLYVYRVHHDNRTYTGIACCLDTREYENGIIRRHELTRYDKEEDRTKHIETMNANTGPVVLLHKNVKPIADIFQNITSTQKPDMVVIADNGSRHEIYTVRTDDSIKKLVDNFSLIPALYIADGHHRCKSAVNVVNRRRDAGKDVPEETYHVLGVAFAEEEVKVHGYSRLLTTLGNEPDSFLNKVKEIASVTLYGECDPSLYTLTPKNTDCHVFHLYINKTWYECTIPKTESLNLIDDLDVSVLQEKVLIPLLNIKDSRGDQRLQYLGGARPVRDLMEKVDSGEYAAAIAMQPVLVQDVFSIADQDGIMPPKSTWFEPKLLSGLLVHQLE